MERVILHCDLNNFYASVECLYHPEIRDKPVAVCGSQSTRHGIVLAKNYTAKKMGVKTGEAIWEARSKCPGLVVARPNYPLYLKCSKEVREICKQYTDLIEAFGIDESWLDVSESTRLFGTGEKIAWEIKETIKRELGLTASIGVSFNKIFAKLGSDLKKPDAVTVISRDNFKSRIWSLPVEELLYVGRSTARKLQSLAVYTIGDLANALPTFLRRVLGKWGEVLWHFANGFDGAEVTRMDFESTIKSIGNSLTTPRDLVNNEEVKILLYVLAESVGERLRRHHMEGNTVQITIKDSELGLIERQGPLSQYTHVSSEIAEKAYEIFLDSWDWSKNIRLVGVRVTNVALADGRIQLSLLMDPRHDKRESLEYCIDTLRGRFGHDSVGRALLLRDPSLKANPIEENIIHPVSYFR